MKALKILGGIVVVFLLAVSVLYIYLYWPIANAKFPVGSCVEDRHIRVTYVVTGNGNRDDGLQVPAEIVDPGKTAAAAYAIGVSARLNPEDPELFPAPCPTP